VRVFRIADPANAPAAQAPRKARPTAPSAPAALAAGPSGGWAPAPGKALVPAAAGATVEEWKEF